MRSEHVGWPKSILPRKLSPHLSPTYLLWSHMLQIMLIYIQYLSLETKLGVFHKSVEILTSHQGGALPGGIVLSMVD